MDKLVLVNEKLDVMGRLTRHDIRNKLSGIGGNIHLLRKLHSDCPDIIQRLNVIDASCKGIVKILDFAKMYEELGVKDLYLVDVDRIIDEAIALFSIPSTAKVINDCQGLTVFADSFLRQLFYTMIDNSVKHGERVTKITIHYEKTGQDKLNLPLRRQRHRHFYGEQIEAF